MKEARVAKIESSLIYIYIYIYIYIVCVCVCVSVFYMAAVTWSRLPDVAAGEAQHSGLGLSTSTWDAHF